MFMDWIKKNSWWLGLLLSLIGIVISILASLPSKPLEHFIDILINNPFPTAVVITFIFLFNRLSRLEDQTKKKDSETEYPPSSLEE